MKRLLLIGLLLLGLSLTAQTSKQSHDARFVGSWSGSEKDQQQLGLEKHWIMHRFADGKFILIFTTVQDGEVSSFSEKGEWWIENNEFHELHYNSDLTDVYAFTILDDYHIRFKSKVVIETTSDSYEFIDTKLIDN